MVAKTPEGGTGVRFETIRYSMHDWKRSYDITISVPLDLSRTALVIADISGQTPNVYSSHKSTPILVVQGQVLCPDKVLLGRAQGGGSSSTAELSDTMPTTSLSGNVLDVMFSEKLGQYYLCSCTLFYLD